MPLRLASDGAPGPAAELSNRQKKLAMKINAARANHGRQPLQLSLKISNKARDHSQKMAASGQIFHSCLTCKFQRTRSIGVLHAVRYPVPASAREGARANDR